MTGKKYDVMLIDPPWSYFGSTTKNAAAGKHYSLLDQTVICSLPIKSLLKKKAYVFVWATGPRLNFAIDAIKSWGLHYRGVAYVWVKSRKSDNAIINGQGVPPTYTKPTTEFLLCATTTKNGRPVPLKKFNTPQVILAPREGHSTKPEVFRQSIEETLGTQTLDCIEVFARTKAANWDVIGNAVTAGEDIRESIQKLLTNS